MLMGWILNTIEGIIKIYLVLLALAMVVAIIGFAGGVFP